MKLLNLGCGDRFLPDWTNVDFNSASDAVIKHNLLQPFPFQDGSFDVVYSSHVLEHFTKQEAESFITEIYRVLKPGGLLRIVVPNLERFVNGYLTCLNNVRVNENEKTIANYEWSVIELLDQMVRVRMGGEMLDYWNRDHLINENYITERLGHEFTRFRDYRKKHPLEAKKLSEKRILPETFLFKLKKRLFKKLFHVEISAEDLLYLQFRKMGESHKWMYDEVSLKRLLMAKQFRDVCVVDALTSNIVGWEKYKTLDMEGDTVRKPDSLFVEAKK